MPAEEEEEEVGSKRMEEEGGKKREEAERPPPPIPPPEPPLLSFCERETDRGEAGKAGERKINKHKHGTAVKHNSPFSPR